MISILIPVHNYDCSRLVSDLARQAVALKEEEGFDCEILLADDASTDPGSQQANRQAVDICGIGRYLRQPHKAGPASNRNTLMEEARFPWLLLIDCDAQVAGEDFLRTYWKERETADVIVGGLENPVRVAPGHELRHRCELRAEKKHTLAYRQANPYAHFSTFNFMARREVLLQIKFDPRCTEYGYEDTLMGLEMRKRGIPLRHIRNPLIHLGIDSNEAFLRKTETAMRTLHRLGGLLQGEVGASRMAAKLERLHAKGVFTALFRLCRPAVRRNLLGKRPSLLLFNLYKLGYYCCLPDTEGQTL